MWLSKRPHRHLPKLALALCAALVISGCSFTPLYGTNNSSADTKLAYGTPATQEDQIIYRELALSLGSTEDPTAPLLNVTSTTSSRQVGRSATGLPTTTRELTLTANATITETDPLNPGTSKTIYSGSKSASATYTTNGQSLADQEARKDAIKRAAKTAAQSLRLSIKAALLNRS